MPRWRGCSSRSDQQKASAENTLHGLEWDFMCSLYTYINTVTTRGAKECALTELHQRCADRCLCFAKFDGQSQIILHRIFPTRSCIGYDDARLSFSGSLVPRLLF
uniref:Ubiquilin n=1 Tax=Alectorobius mimon TaxID=360319 RepID=A0A147B9E2_9ACAR